MEEWENGLDVFSQDTAIVATARISQPSAASVTGITAAFPTAMKIQCPATMGRVFPAAFAVMVGAKRHLLNPLECGRCNA
jgi:hypothetical protein